MQLPEMVQALLDPKAYPDAPQEIELAQTQMSFVFLTGEYVYKVKKPVNLDYLDYTSLDKRLFYCRREVELNQRLCPDTYLGVVPITRHIDNISVDGKGEVIEYAVKMRRLPQEAMMDRLLMSNQVSPQMMARVARKLAEFHEGAEIVSDFADINTLIKNTEENFSQTVEYIGRTISQATYRRVKGYTITFIESNASLFRRRITGNRIRDCHGDLHAAHICFTDGICIYDCIEFNDRFRYCDVAAEVAFLAMDLDRYDCSDLSKSFVNTYVEESQDKELLELLDFYKCYFAYVRGKVDSFKLDDPYISEDEKVRISDVAKRYFKLAESYI